MYKKIIMFFFISIIVSTAIFSEIIILKDGKEVRGKIIKMDEDTMTIITKTEEMVIDKEDIIKIYYSEKEYAEEKSTDNSIPIKLEITGPHIVGSFPENGAIDILRNTAKVITIKFNEAMDKVLSYECSEEINKPKWLNPQTLQIELKNPLDYGKTFKLVLNPSAKKQIMKSKLKVLLSPDTIFFFTTKDVKWTTIYTDDFNRTDSENGDIGINWKVNNNNGSATVKIENNELVMSRKLQNLAQEPASSVGLNKMLSTEKKAVRIYIKFKNEFIRIGLSSSTEFIDMQIYLDKLHLNYVYNNKDNKKDIDCQLPINKYCIAEIIREKTLLLCTIKDEEGTILAKGLINTPENDLSSSMNIFIGAGGNKVPFVYIDDLEVAIY